MDYQQQGIVYAVENLKQGHIAGWGKMAEGDRLRLSFEARDLFYTGVRLVEELPQTVKQAIYDGGFAQIDWVWSRGLVPTWLFPYIREMGVLTMTVADDQGQDMPFVARCERGS